MKRLHDELSADLLEILPLPFVITGSSYTRDRLRKQLSGRVRSFDLILVPPLGRLRFDLDFRDGTLRRIILYVHHPTAGFFQNRDSRVKMAVQIDAGMNFFLWSLGKQHDPNTFQRHYASCGCPRLKKSAPLLEMWNYVKVETAEKRYLQLEDYSSLFVRWVGRFLRRDPTAVLAARCSLAGEAAKIIRKRMSQSHHLKRT